MQLSRATELGIRILVQIAAQDDAASTAEIKPPRHTSSTIAVAISAPQTHVAKVVSRLADLGLLNSTRGRTGGIVLAENALSKPLGAFIREMEGERLTGYRVHDSDPFDPERRLHKVIGHAIDEFFADLDKTTIADLVPETPARANQP